jgi:hypothetical protein
MQKECPGQIEVRMTANNGVYLPLLVLLNMGRMRYFSCTLQVGIRICGNTLIKTPDATIGVKHTCDHLR